jgi:hypothetical protein
MLAGGMYMIPKDLLDSFRKTVAQEGPARELFEIVEGVKENGIEVGGLHFKRIPRGFEETHPYSEFLKYNGVYGMITIPIPDELFGPQLLDLSFERFRTMDPLNRWFLKYLH